MAIINRSSIISNQVDTLGLQPGSDKIPVELDNKIIPVFEIAPKVTTILKTITSTATGSTTSVYITPTSKDFYLTYIGLSITKDAANDLTTVPSIDVYVNGLRTKVICLNCQPLTAESHTFFVALPYPIKLDRGSQIYSVMTWAAGTATRTAVIGGYILE